MTKTWLMMQMCKCLVLAVLWTVSLPGFAAEEAVVVLRSTVTGNQEQPKVLYLVPWQQADGPESLYRPLHSLVNEVFEPIERREFIRELNYRQNLADQHTNHFQTSGQ